MKAEAYESTLQLIRDAQAGDKAALEQLVTENAALVKFVAKRYLNRGREFDDLDQLGCLGLLKASRNFDVDYGVQFSTYAVPLILGEIRRYLRDDGLVRVSRSIKENAAKVNRAAEKLFSESGQEPDIQALSEATQLSQDEVLMALEASRPTRSLNEPLSSDGSLILADTLGVDETEETDQRIALSQMLAELSEQERMLLERRYFLRHTQSAIAKDMGVSQVQISRMESRILKKLRERVS